jgi:hypothetical protein
MVRIDAGDRTLRIDALRWQATHSAAARAGKLAILHRQAGSSAAGDSGHLGIEIFCHNLSIFIPLQRPSDITAAQVH